MDVASVRNWLARHRTASSLAALLLVFAGVDLLLNPPKGALIEFLAIPFLAAGLLLFAAAFWPEGRPAVPVQEDTLASRLLHRLTFRGRLVRWFPVLGVAIVVTDLAYNAYLSPTPALLTEDTIVLLFAASLLAYNVVPARFGRERDFVLVFMASVVAILVIPLLLSRVWTADFERSVDGYSWVALAPQTSWILGVLGVPNTLGAVSGSTAPGISFVTNAGVGVTVVITTACSGIYSFGIFTSAFVAYVLTEFRRVTLKVPVLLVLGFVTSYAANILRMVAIVLVGVYTDTPESGLQNMLVAHSNFGWIIFLAWIALFWGIVLRVTGAGETDVTGAALPRKHGVLCGLCEDALTPALPGYRCECGKFYHVACAATVEECPRCRARMPQLPGAVSEGPKPV